MHIPRPALVALLYTLLMFPIAQARAQVVDGENAVEVITGLGLPRAVAVDAVHHRLFIGDAGGNNRILVYNRR